MTKAQHVRKMAWQRTQRRRFAVEHGYSTAADYATGRQRAVILERDGHACVACGLTATEHLERWDRPITIDHIDKDRSHNAMNNLQTLCLECHGRKDITPALIVSRTEPMKERIIELREQGTTYQAIADALQLSIGAIWNACRRWEIAQ